tara:strand:+ start:6370 stop:6612 length:243 start_codon:yes stop_codon:yes gene_type:complete
MAKSETHDEVIEAICDFNKGWTNLDSASKELGKLAGLSPDVSAALLKGMKQNNITQIRGYSKEKPYQLAAKVGKPNEAKK